MTDSVDELIKEIAVKHGIAVSRDDPILVLQTINRRLMEDTAKAQQDQLNQYKEEVEAIALRWGNDATDKAERILNASLAASKDLMRRITEECAREAAKSLKMEIDTIRVGTATPIAKMRRIGLLNVLASCITIVAIVIAFGVLVPGSKSTILSIQNPFGISSCR